MDALIAAQVVAGAVLLVVTAADILVTTTSVSSGRGPLSAQVAARVWSSVLAVHKRAGNDRLLQAAGPVILFGIILTWVMLLSAGWALVFAAPGALEGSGGTSFASRMHFAATTVAGRGTADLQVADGGWWLVEQLCGLTGVALIGLSIAYVLPVVRAVVQMRQVAASVTALGGSPQEILANSWDGETFGDLDLHFINLTGLINVTTQMHLAYPVVYYFHSPYRDFALAPSVVVLDETLTLVACALDGRPELSDTAWRPTRAAIDQLLTVVNDSAVERHPDVPPMPTLGDLRRLGLPLRDDDEVAAAIDELAERRRLLRGLLSFEGRTWPPQAELEADEPTEDGADPESTARDGDVPADDEREPADA